MEIREEPERISTCVKGIGFIVLVLVLLLPFDLSEVMGGSPTVTMGDAYVREDPRFIYLGNDYIEIILSKKDNGGIYSLVNKRAGHDYRTDKESEALLYWITLVDISDLEEEFYVTNLDAAMSWHRIQQLPNGVKLTMEASGFGGWHNREPRWYNLETTVTIIVYDDSPLTRWRIAVKNHEPLAIRDVVLPLICGFEKIGEDSSNDYVLLPSWLGGGLLLRDPYESIIQANKGGQSKIYPLSGVQFMALYDEQGGGLYLATYDTEGNVKAFAIKRWNGNLSIRVHHLNPEVPGENYSMSYDTVVGVHDGDWYTAADIYREWAIKQWWTKQGPLHQREDVPEWFKEAVPMIGILSYANYPGGSKYTFARTAALVNFHSDYLNMPVMPRWMGWEKEGAWTAPDSFPPHDGGEACKKAIEEMHVQGNRTMLGLSAGLWFTGFDSFAKIGKQWTVVNRDGTLESEDEGRFASVCLSSPIWQEFVLNNALQAAKYGVDGLQIDQFPCDVYGCYNPEHDHPLGYGKWWLEACKKMVSTIREETRKINPNLILAGEGMYELLIPYFEMYLSDDHSFFINDCFVREYGTEFVRIVPLFSYIYHDYISTCTRGGVRKGMNMTWTVAEAFVRGKTQNVYEAFLVSDVLDLYWKTALATFGYAHDFLFYGRMLPSPSIKVPKVKVTHLLPGGALDIETSSVLHSAWMAPDRSIGYVFVNIWNRSISFNLNIDLSTYGLPNNVEYSIYAVRDGKFELISPHTTLPEDLQIDIDPKQVIVVNVLKPSQLESVEQQVIAFKSVYTDGAIIGKAKEEGYEVSEAMQLLEEAKVLYKQENFQSALELGVKAVIKLGESLRAVARESGLDVSSAKDYSSQAKILLQDREFVKSGEKASKACQLLMGLLELRVLFDDFHDELASISLERAKEIARGRAIDHPELYYLGDFSGLLEKYGFAVVRETRRPLTYEELELYTFVVIAVPRQSFSNAEVDALIEFVEEGGGLLILGDAWISSAINPLTREFGVYMDPEAVRAKEYLEEEGEFLVTNFDSLHPVTKNISLATVNWMCPMTVTGQAEALAYTPVNTHSDGRKGPFPYIAVTEYGKGRVAIFADQALFVGPFYRGSQHEILAENVMRWLSENESMD